MENKKIKKVLKITGLSFLSLIFLMAIAVFYFLSTLSDRKPFPHNLIVKIAVFDSRVKDYFEKNKKFPESPKEIIPYLDTPTSRDTNKGTYTNIIAIFTLQTPPENEDIYFKPKFIKNGNPFYSGYYINEDRIIEADIEIKPMYLGYYVNKDLTVYAIYGVDKDNKIFRDKRYENTPYYNKIFYYSNQ